MPSLLAPTQILSAYAFAVPDDGFDPYLTRGTHIRTYAGLGPSFPVTPLIVRGFRHEGWRNRCQFFAFDPDGREVGQPDPFSADLGQAESLTLHLIFRDPADKKTTSISVHSSDGDEAIRGVALLDKDRVIGVKLRPPYIFAAPSFSKLTVRGSGMVRVDRKLMPVGMSIEFARDIESVLMTLSLPVEEAFPWYLGIQGRDAGINRVKRGVPKQLNPMDRPFGSLDPVDPNAEVDRVLAAMDTLKVDGHLDALMGRLVRDETKVPWQQTETMDEMGPTKANKPQFAEISRQGTLQLAGVDPGIARYLGYAGMTERLPADGFDAIAIFGLFAVGIEEFRRFDLNLDDLAQYTPVSGEVQAYAESLRTLGFDRRQEIQTLALSVLQRGCAIAPFETVLEACEPWEPPSVPEPQVFQRHWQPIDAAQGTPSRYYRATFAFPHLPMVSQSGLARLEGGTWVGRNERIEGSDRAVPGLFGVEKDPKIRGTELGIDSLSLKPLPILADHDIDSENVPTTFGVWASDMFGRFPDGGRTFDVEPPPRPWPPKPVLRFRFERTAGEIAAGVSPGKLTVSVAVPHPLPQQPPFDDYNALATAIVVPRLDDLPAGAFDLATLYVGINTPDHQFNLAAPGMSSIEIDVPPLTEGQVETTYRVVGRYTDTIGNPSDDTEVFFTVRNFRSPVILDAGVGLIWTSDPGPSPEVEVKLKWPSAAGNQYRVYLADQAGMGITPAELADEGPVPSRGHIAKVGATKPGDRKQFRLLTDPPVIAAGSTTVFTATLPRSLETVQFLRVVPLGSDGDEAEFDKCGIVPVAVPESRRPPPPQVDASVDPATGYATLHISTDGADRSILERDEPGLFNPGEAGNEPPRAILRRAVAGVADPIYARRILKEPVAMTLDPATGRYMAKIEDNNGDRGLEPYVNYVYWAEWQMPPERRLPAKVTEIHVGEIEAVDPSSIRDRPRPFSPPSAPRVVTYVPAAGPRAPVPEDVVVSIEASPAPDTVTVALKLAEPPSTHKLAAERYRLAIWTQWLNKPIEAIKNANGTELSASWPEIESGEVATVIAKDLEDNGLMLRLAMVDPVGRMSTITLKPA